MIRIEVGGERWEVDDDFLASRWTCIWGRGCQGIDFAPDPSGTLGCCILVGLLLPMLDGGAFVMPALLTLEFWMRVLALFLGFAVVIAVMFFIKSLFVGRGHGHSRHAH